MFQLYFFSLNQVTTIFGGICGLYSMFKSDGTIDKIFTGGAGKNGATVAVSFKLWLSCMILALCACGFCVPSKPLEFFLTRIDMRSWKVWGTFNP